MNTHSRLANKCVATRHSLSLMEGDVQRNDAERHAATQPWYQVLPPNAGKRQRSHY